MSERGHTALSADGSPSPTRRSLSAWRNPRNNTRPQHQPHDQYPDRYRKQRWQSAALNFRVGGSQQTDPALIKADRSKRAPALIKAPDRQCRPAAEARTPGRARPKTASCGPLVPNIALSMLDEHSCAKGNTHSALQAWMGSTHRTVRYGVIIVAR